MTLLYLLLRNWLPHTVNSVFGKAQLASAGYMGFAHGSNDAQKTISIIALALASGGPRMAVLKPSPNGSDFSAIPWRNHGDGRSFAA